MDFFYIPLKEEDFFERSRLLSAAAGKIVFLFEVRELEQLSSMRHSHYNYQTLLFVESINNSIVAN